MGWCVQQSSRWQCGHVQAPVAAPACQTEHCGRLQTELEPGWVQLAAFQDSLCNAENVADSWTMWCLTLQGGWQGREDCLETWDDQYSWKTLGCEIVVFVEIFPELAWWKTQHENVGRRVVCIETLLWLVLLKGNLVSLAPFSVFWGLDTWQPTRQFRSLHH